MRKRSVIEFWSLCLLLACMVIAVSCGSPAPAPTPPPAPPPAALAAPPPSAPEAGTAPGGDQGQLLVQFPGGSTTAPKNDLLARWMDLAKTASREKPNIEEGITLVRDIAKDGPAALAPLYDVLADKASSPYAKAMAAMSLMAMPDASQVARVAAMTTPGNDFTTRVCATSILGAIMPSTEADAALGALKNDTERQVRFQALRGLAMRSAEGGRKAFGDLYRQPDTTPAEKGDIVSALSFGPASDSITLFQDALKDMTVDESVRGLAAQLMGRAGNQSSIAPLNECIEKDPSQKVKDAAKLALDALNSRLKTPITDPAAPPAPAAAPPAPPAAPTAPPSQ